MHQKYRLKKEKVKMKTFEYVIKDELGIHARPAGLLAKEAKKYSSKIVLKKETAAADMTRLMSVMAMGVKQGERIIVEVEGEDEETACHEIRSFFENNL